MNKLWFIFHFSRDRTKLSSGADLSSSWVSLISSPVNERTMRVASEKGFTEGVLSELGLKIDEESFGVWLEEARKIEDEKKRDGVLWKMVCEIKKCKSFS